MIGTSAAVFAWLRPSKTISGFLCFETFWIPSCALPRPPLLVVDPTARACSAVRTGNGVSSPRRDNKRERVKNRPEESSEGVIFPRMLVTKFNGFETFRFRDELVDGAGWSRREWTGLGFSSMELVLPIRACFLRGSSSVGVGRSLPDFVRLW